MTKFTPETATRIVAHGILSATPKRRPVSAGPAVGVVVVWFIAGVLCGTWLQSLLSAQP